MEEIGKQKAESGKQKENPEANPVWRIERKYQNQFTTREAVEKMIDVHLSGRKGGDNG